MARVQLDYQAYSPPNWRDWPRWLYGMMTGPRARRVYLRTLLICLLLVVSGYVSDLITEHSCQSDTARYVFYGDLSGKPFWTPDRLSDAIFRNAGITPSIMNAYGPPWQRASIQPSLPRWPFLVSVEYSDDEGQWQRGGRRTYVCFFGFKFLIGEDHWPKVQAIL